MNTFKTALVQTDTQRDPLKSLDEIKIYIKEAALNGADFVMLPEVCDYTAGRHNISITDTFKKTFAALAKEYKIWLHGGSIHEYTGERSADDLPYNTTFVYAPDGTQVTRYRKIHMFDVNIENGPCIRESDIFTSAEDIISADTDFGKIGLSICYDIRFPHMFRKMALSGANILCCSANFTKPTGEAHWEILLKARAIETGSYVFACNQCGVKKDFTAYGNSMIIDPWGRILERADTAPGIIYADIDLSQVKNVRSRVPVLSYEF